MVETASVSLEEGQVAIDGLTIDDPTVVEYFEEFEDEGLDRQLERVISVGVTAFRRAICSARSASLPSRFVEQ